MSPCLKKKKKKKEGGRGGKRRKTKKEEIMIRTATIIICGVGGAVVMAQGLRAPAVLLEDLNLTPRTHMKL